MTATPLVVRGFFIYNDTFLAEAGGSKRHPRASVPELKALLQTEDSSAPNPPKDQVGHWYTAQCLHYGIAKPKDKATAKSRLRKALEDDSLTVPPYIVALEKDMKKEFVAAVKKAKGAEKPAKGKKRAYEEETASNTRVSLTVGGVTLDVDHQSAASRNPATKKTRKSKEDEAPAKAVKPKDEKPAPKSRTKKPKDETSTAKPRAAPKTKAEKPDSKSIAVNGTYMLELRMNSVPTTNGLPRLSIHNDLSTRTLWGHFTIGTKIGVLRIDNFIAPTEGELPEVSRLEWRARDTETGRLRSGPGMLEFELHGVGKGTLYRLFDRMDADIGVGGEEQVVRDTLIEEWPGWEHEWEMAAYEAELSCR